MPSKPRPAPELPSPGDVRATWEAIAGSFDATRGHPWEPVTTWCDETLQPRARVLDLACGNGRHGLSLAERGHAVVAVDLTRGLLERARSPGAEATPGFHPIQADAAALPLRDGSVEGALFVAGLHHVPGRARRVGVLAELRRVLAPGAPALVTAWARWQDRWLGALLRDLPGALLAGRDAGDVTVPWRRGDAPVERYYHLYTRRELRADLHAAGFRDVRVWGERLTGSRLPDNWFGAVRR